MKNVKIIVAAHKPYTMPEDSCYLPLHVGAEGKEDIGFTRDDSGDNISAKNPFFCELTGLYWAWKNLDADYIGLAHYRRHFSKKSRSFIKKNGVFASVLSAVETEDILSSCDVILPTLRKYYIETLYSHYEHTLHIEPLDLTREIIAKKYPDYLENFDRQMNRRSGHMFNMFIMKRELLDGYCSWLFDILFELETVTDQKAYDVFHSRFYGRISELLLDVWLDKNELSYAEVPVVSTEKVNWLKKGTAFIRAKFTGKKYEKSF